MIMQLFRVECRVPGIGLKALHIADTSMESAMKSFSNQKERPNWQLYKIELVEGELLMPPVEPLE